MDGLLFNTEAIYRDATIAAAIEAGYHLPVEFYLGTIGLPGEATRARFAELFGEAFDFDSFWTASKKRFAEATAAQLYLKAGVVELLDLLDKLQGYFRIASIAHYLVIDPDKRLVIHHTRGHDDVIGTRIITSGAVTLDPPGLALRVVDFFASAST